jgi:hypothetical protein
LLGPRLTALVAYLKGVCHASFSTVRKFLRDVVGVTVSCGQLAKVSAALEGPYQELLERVPDEDRLNADETEHKDWGDQLWTWCFWAELAFEFKGNTAVGFQPTPPLLAGHVPIYQRAHYRRDKTPLVKKERFVPAKIIRW